MHSLEVMLWYKPQHTSSDHLIQSTFGCSKSLFQSHNCVWLFATPWTAAYQPFRTFTISQSLLKCMSVNSVMPSNHLILCHPHLLQPQSFPASRSFLMSQLFSSGGQSIGVSASASVSVSPSNEYSGLISFRIDWFDFFAVQGTLKSLLLTTVQSINSLVLSLLYGPTLTSLHD